MFDRLKHPRSLAALSLLVAVVTYFLLILNGASINRYLLELSFPNIEAGRAPDGTLFDIGDIKSENNINRAIKELKLKDVDAKSVKKYINITPLIASDTSNKIEKEIKNDRKYISLPNTYTLNIEPFRDSKKLINKLIENYKKDFLNKYSDNNPVKLFFENMDYTSSDYIEIAENLEMRIDFALSYYNENLISEVSPESSSIFNLKEMCMNIKNNELLTFKSYLEQSGVTKNAAFSDVKYKFHINELSRRNTLLDKKITFLKQAAAEYDFNGLPDMRIPVITSSGNMIQGNIRTCYDDILEQQQFIETNYANNNTKIGQANQFSALYKNSAPSAQKHAEALLENIKTKIKSLEEQAGKAENSQNIEFRTEFINTNLVNSDYLIYSAVIALSFFMLITIIMRRKRPDDIGGTNGK